MVFIPGIHLGIFCVVYVYPIYATLTQTLFVLKNKTAASTSTNLGSSAASFAAAKQWLVYWLLYALGRPLLRVLQNTVDLEGLGGTGAAERILLLPELQFLLFLWLVHPASCGALYLWEEVLANRIGAFVPIKKIEALKQLQKTLQGGLNEACRNGDVHQIRSAYESWLHHDKVLARPTCLFAQTMQGVLQAIGHDVYEAVAFIEEVFNRSKEHVQTTESLLFLLLRSFVVRGEVLAHNHGEAKGVGEEDDENVSAKSALLEKAVTHFHEAGKTLNRTALKLRTCLPLLELTALFGRSDKAEEFYANQLNDDQRNWELVFVYRLKAALASRCPGEGKSAKDLVEAIVGQLASTCPRLALTEADAEKEVGNKASTWAVLRRLLAAHYD
eukprot:g2106.t1